jgi:alanyl-tRNA synthetase
MGLARPEKANTVIYAYEREPYLTRLEVRVVSVGEDGGRPYAVLDDTILYPEGGGQPADRGRLGETAVVDVQKKDGVVRHYLAGAAAAGPAVLALDWGRRFDHMQQHTAQHLLSAIAADRFGWATTSFHLGDLGAKAFAPGFNETPGVPSVVRRARRAPGASDVELDAPALSLAQVAELEEAVAAEVRVARPVRARRVTPEEYAGLGVRTRGLPEGHSGDVRLVEIAGIDLTTCGGTHLASTAEIEAVALLGSEPMRGGTRLYFAAGGRARRRLAEHEARAGELRRVLEAPEEELAAAARAKLDQLREAQRRGRDLEQRLAEALADGLAARGETPAELHLDDVDGGFLQRVAGRFQERAPAGAALLTAASPQGMFFALAAGAASPLDVRAAGARVAELLEGRGGGSGRLFQGKAGSLARRAEALAAMAAALGS